VKGEKNTSINPDNMEKLEHMKELMDRERKAWEKLLKNLDRLKKNLKKK
jgi:hypothetical protein